MSVSDAYRIDSRVTIVFVLDFESWFAGVWGLVVISCLLWDDFNFAFNLIVLF